MAIDPLAFDPDDFLFRDRWVALLASAQHPSNLPRLHATLTNMTEQQRHVPLLDDLEGHSSLWRVTSITHTYGELASQDVETLQAEWGIDYSDVNTITFNAVHNATVTYSRTATDIHRAPGMWTFLELRDQQYTDVDCSTLPLPAIEDILRPQTRLLEHAPGMFAAQLGLYGPRQANGFFPIADTSYDGEVLQRDEVGDLIFSDEVRYMGPKWLERRTFLIMDGVYVDIYVTRYRLFANLGVAFLEPESIRRISEWEALLERGYS
ncbi:MAG: hypothetical protein AAFV53_37420 [Myxococcota bacterium]